MLQDAPTARERALFWVALVLVLCPTAWTLLDHRYPVLWDTTEAMQASWVFLNGLRQSGEVPQWFPHFGHGETAIIQYFLAASPAQSLYLLYGHLWLPDAFLVLYALGVGLEEVVFLVGTWLLARRFVSPGATFLVAISTVLPCHWYTQVFWNLRLYSMLPLVMALGHRWLDTGRARYLVAGASLYLVQLTGNQPYFAPVTSLFLAVWAVGWLASPMGRRQVGARPPVVWMRGLALTAVVGALEALSLRHVLGLAVEHSVMLAPGRSPDGSTPLHTFLTYGGTASAARWIEALTGWNDELDVGLYSGLLCVPLAILGAPTAMKKAPQVPLALIAIVAFMHWDTFATWAYQLWPQMPLYRHRAFPVLLPRAMFVMLAGFGFDRLRGSDGFDRGAVRLTAAMCALCGVILVVCPWLPARCVYPELGFAPSFEHELAALVAGCWAAACIAWAFATIALAADRGHGWTTAAFLLLQVADVGAFRMVQQGRRTSPLVEEARSVYRFRAIAQPTSRYHTGQEGLRGRAFPPLSERVVSLLDASPRTQTATTAEFLMIRETGANARIDHWTRYVDALFGIYATGTLDSSQARASWHPFARELLWRRGEVQWPVGPNQSALAVAGVEGMLTVHRSATPVSDDAEARDALLHADQRGHVLYVLGAGSDDAAPGDDTRLTDVQVEVLHVSANRVDVQVRGAPPDSWLYYADAWHPSWTATVDGRETVVHRANVAYKAVLLPAGDHIVRFRYYQAAVSALMCFLGLHATALVAGIIWVVARLGFRDPSGRKR